MFSGPKAGKTFLHPSLDDFLLLAHAQECSGRAAPWRVLVARFKPSEQKLWWGIWAWCRHWRWPRHGCNDSHVQRPQDPLSSFPVRAVRPGHLRKHTKRAAALFSQMTRGLGNNYGVSRNSNQTVGAASPLPPRWNLVTLKHSPSDSPFEAGTHEPLGGFLSKAPMSSSWLNRLSPLSPAISTTYCWCCVFHQSMLACLSLFRSKSLTHP